jgi:cell division protein FtsI (penicillin-binding protein 3)
MYVMLTLLGLLPVLIGLQIMRLHLNEGEELRQQGERQASSFQTIPAIRGAIFDRAGRTLAVNAARYDLALDPTANGLTPQVAGSFFDRLSRLTGQPAHSIRRRVEQRSSPQYVLLMRGLSESHKEQVEQWGVPGLILTPTFARRYNYASTAAHILGHVDTDGRGIAGVEMQYDRFLHGEDGRRAVKRDRRGVIKAFVGGQVVEPKHGESIVLTIDLVRQTILEEELEKGVRETGAKWGTAIAMDPHTGAILAMASYPTYDPNRPSSFPESARRLHAVTDRMEPGSTFKKVAAIAAYEQGLVTLQDTIDTGPGWAVFGGRTMRDTRPLGRVSFEDVITFSSNVGTARIAQQMDSGVLYQYARNLGYGQPTYIDIPGEVSGTLRKTHNWSGTDKTSMSIGYAVDATPLQIVTAYSAFANGGLLVHPHVVAERRDVTGRTIWTAPIDSVRRVFQSETSAALLPAFEKVIEKGTARQAQVPGLRVAGKTGTARKVEQGRYVAGAYRGSFVGFFPAEAPRVAMIVVMDEPRTSSFGGVVSAPVFQRVAHRWLATFPEIADRVAPIEELPERSTIFASDLTDRPAAVASARLASEGLSVAWPDERLAPRRVMLQEPTSADTTQPGARVRFTVDTSDPLEPVMPELTGLTAREAVFWLSALGVDARIEGNGLVAAQTPAAGTPLPTEATVRLR